MQTRILTALVLFALLIVAGLVLAFPSLFMSWFVRPVALVLWVIWRLFISIDQLVYWVGLLLSCILLAMRLVPSDASHLEPPALRPDYPSGRLAYWRGLLAGGLRGRRNQDALRERLRRLLESLVSQEERPGSTGIVDLIATGKVALPPRLEHYLFPELAPRMGFSIAARFRHLISGHRDEEKALVDLLSWMESRLEYKND